jgi:hypothetical protein
MNWKVTITNKAINEVVEVEEFTTEEQAVRHYTNNKYLLDNDYNKVITPKGFIAVGQVFDIEVEGM